MLKYLIEFASDCKADGDREGSQPQLGTRKATAQLV